MHLKLISMVENFQIQIKHSYQDASFSVNDLLSLKLSRNVLSLASTKFLQSSFWETTIDTLLERSFEVEVGIFDFLNSSICNPHA